MLDVVLYSACILAISVYYHNRCADSFMRLPQCYITAILQKVVESYHVSKHLLPEECPPVGTREIGFYRLDVL